MRSMTFAVVACAIATPIVAAGTASAQSGLVEYSWNRGDSTEGVAYSDAAGQIRGIYTSYDAASETFTWRTTVADHTTDAISVVVNGGGNPKGHVGELAQIFYDGDTVSVYAYNGKDVNNLYSFESGTGMWWQPADTIASSRDDDSFVISANKYSSGGDRIFELVLDVSGINDHNPQYGSSSDWDGIQYDDTVGIWLKTYDQKKNVSYNHDGFLKCWDFCQIGYFDTDGRPTVPAPATAALAGAAGLFASRRRRA